MSDDPKMLIPDYLDGRLTDDGARELNDWVRRDPGNARALAAYALLHNRLQDCFRLRADLDQALLPKARPRRRRGIAAALAGVALAVLGTWGVLHWQEGGVASLVEAQDVVWALGQQPIKVGGRLGPREIHCASGVFKLRFDDGALVSIQGPAEIHVLSGTRIRAVRGRITALVDGPAQGFTIETPTTLVVDRGTEFGVEVDKSGRTDVIVFQGIVDLSRSEPATEPASIRRLGRGEGMRVGSTGDLSRIVAVESRANDANWSTGPWSDQGDLIRSVRDNIRGLESSKYYRIVHQGLGEDAPAYVDRIHQWNGLGPEGIPAFLRGADYIMTFNEDKWRGDLSITIESAAASTLYIFYDMRFATPGWLSERFQDTGFRIGLDAGSWPGGPPLGVAIGPGASIDNTFSIWSRDLAANETVDLGGLGVDLEGAGSAMYGIAAVRRP